MLFGLYGTKRKSFLNSGNGGGGFGLSGFGNKVKDMATFMLNKSVTNGVDKAMNKLADTTGVGDLIGKDNVQKGIDMVKGSIGNLF